MEVQFDTDRIDQYLFMELPEADRADFEREMELNPDLAQKVALQRALICAIREEGKKDFLQMVETPLENPAPPKKSRKLWLSLVLPLAAAAFLLFYLQGPSPHEALVRKHFVMDPGWPITLGVNSKPLDVQEAMSAYRIQDYGLAEDLFEALLAEQSSSDTLHYFLGQIALHDLVAEKAGGHFRMVLNQAQSSFLPGAEWGMALVHVLNEESDEAQSLLQEISENKQHYHWKEAEILLLEIRNTSAP